MTITWIEEPGTVGELGVLGVPICADETLYRCWLFNVFDASGKLIYVEGSDIPIQQGTAWDCKWLCEYKPDQVEAKLKALWNQFFSPSMAGKGPIVRAKVIRYNKYDIEPTWVCTKWDGITATSSKSCTIYGRSQQTGAQNVPTTYCGPGYRKIVNADGSVSCIPENIPLLPQVRPTAPLLPPFYQPFTTNVTTVPSPIPQPPIQRVAGPSEEKSALGAAVEVATSGIIPALVVLGVLGLAVYGFVKVMQREGYASAELEENPGRKRRVRARRGRRRALGRYRRPVRRRRRRRRSRRRRA
jgi:hypothetical protein